MAIQFESADGRQGELDVVNLVSQEFGPGAKINGVKDGLIHILTPEGELVAFKLGEWAMQHNVNIVGMYGFNSPSTALDMPPSGMNYLDQSVFYNDGMDMQALQELYPQSQKQADGRVVVLDSDGLWKTMWSPGLTPPEPPLEFDEQVARGMVNDPRLVIRTAGVTMLLAICGIDAKQGPKGFRPKDIAKAFATVGANAPYENKFQLAKLVEQTTGLDQWKFYNACLAPADLGMWLERAQQLNSFQYRCMQMEMAEVMADGMRAMAQRDFQGAMKELVKLEETKDLIVNLGEIFQEFVQFLVGLDLLRDISRTTGLNEWISLNEDNAYDQSKLPPMPAFVDAFVKLLRWALPIVKDSKLSMARGKNGLKAIIALMVMIDECIYSLAGVPDSSAKYKMFMGLKKLQAKIETKLAFHYQPDPIKNKHGLMENEFMKAKSFYIEKRESLYKLCQLPKESWNNTILEELKASPNLEKFYDSLPQSYSKLLKSFAAMDTAYDIQPWVDVDHAKRTHDPFSQYNESFGLTPPEAGYLAKNSPRAVFNISETLLQGAAVLSAGGEAHSRQLLRNPWLLANLIKTLMVASVNREIGTVEVMSKFGVTPDMDKQASIDPARIWEDPELVEQDQQRQIEELMGSLALEQGMLEQQAAGRAQQQASMQEQMGAEKGGAGPAGPPMRAQPVGARR